MRETGSHSLVWSDPGIIAGRTDHLRSPTPLGIDHIELILRLAAASTRSPDRILDLGAGHGLLTGALLDEHPASRATVNGVDRQTPPRSLDPHLDRLDHFSSDLTSPYWDDSLRHSTPFDLILGGESLEGLSSTGKRAAFDKIRRLLSPGGRFLSVESLPSATRWTRGSSEDLHIRAIFGAALAAHSDADAAEIARAYFEDSPRRTVRIASLEEQMEWLREAGLQKVECYFAAEGQVIYGGQRR